MLEGLILGTLQPSYNKVEYWIGIPDNEEAITAGRIHDLLVENYDTMYETEGKFDADCFVKHFNAEEPGLKMPDDFGTKPFRIIQILVTLNRRRAFKGTCPVCEGWQ